jgi:4-hydroxy-tetrahydrodipicolinate synthase
MAKERLKGVIAAAATPIREDNTIDLPKLAAHCGWLLAHGCDGINLLGTTGEATSFTVEERLAAMQTVARSPLPLNRVMVGTGAAALGDAVRLTAAARDLGFAGALLLPPFYYKGIDAQSLVAYVETVMSRVGKRGLNLYLYHFPQLSGVPYAVDVVERLHREHPEHVVGVKDSSGDLAFSAELARRLPTLDVFPSAEGALAKVRDHRFAGCISATANITAPLAAKGWKELGTAAGAKAVEDATAIRSALSAFPVISSTKWALADLLGDASWHRLAPPLRVLTAEEQATLRAALAKTRYAQLTR